ncbi:MAG: hypothetical protein NXI30_29020 [bacterium]|nr:hypothetical protein [bacterium]
MIDTDAFEYAWDVKAETEDYTADDGTVFPGAIRVVHWRLTVTDPETGKTSRRSGSEPLGLPSDESEFIDLDDLQGRTAASRREIVIGWAEAKAPGFIEREVAAATARLVHKIEGTRPQARRPVVVL